VLRDQRERTTVARTDGLLQFPRALAQLAEIGVSGSGTVAMATSFRTPAVRRAGAKGGVGLWIGYNRVAAGGLSPSRGPGGDLQRRGRCYPLRVTAISVTMAAITTSAASTAATILGTLYGRSPATSPVRPLTRMLYVFPACR
jgi:hypothetical protein